MDVRLIAAVGRSGQLGLGGKLPWHDPADLAWFKRMTTPGFVIVGGRTYDTMPNLRPDRIKIGWGRDIDPEGLLKMCHTMDPALPIWIAGGARTYAAFLPFVRHFVITAIDYDGPADVFMPKLWGDPVDTSDIPEVGEEFFRRAKVGKIGRRS
ncbi:dihydrofolate reductase [Mesorhizobium sp. M2A.F.Ca.ET.039.01.1.1]|uniref:dihydrofolate reductase n=1 Tax=Mesorhizobium sp. M2A.F.Ca.ET.039.01.1.1 TaxID=2496746 RepID=UPI000FCC5AA7|nr:dihydrofolate reductase [Mesorhizobium sp. M2A.F.Ca.ET.039.01.1.1]RWX72517.1 dihydrofolate reductase [Mesorhizobium sp. M2A.F.Ca.ET.039.01.1.1]